MTRRSGKISTRIHVLADDLSPGSFQLLATLEGFVSMGPGDEDEFAAEELDQDDEFSEDEFEQEDEFASEDDLGDDFDEDDEFESDDDLEDDDADDDFEDED